MTTAIVPATGLKAGISTWFAGWPDFGLSVARLTLTGAFGQPHKLVDLDVRGTSTEGQEKIIVEATVFCE